MQGELIVRIFLHGLILVVPQLNPPTGPENDTLLALLVRDEHHQPLLRYCGEFQGNGEKCKQISGTPFSLDGWNVSFGFTERAPDQPGGDPEAAATPGRNASPRATASWRRYHCKPNDPPYAQGVARCAISADPPMGHPNTPNDGTDFDWTAGLSEILGGNYGSIDMSSGKVYSKVEFSQGTVGVCEFVKVRRKCLVKRGGRSFVVPLVEFKDHETGTFTPRAVPLSLVVELVEKEAEAFVIELRKVDGSETQVIPAPRKCRGHGTDKDLCIEFIISNLPDDTASRVECGDDIGKNIEDLTGTHWQNYYKLLSNVQQGPNPRPVAGHLREPGGIVPACPVFPPRGFSVFKDRKSWDWELWQGPRSTEDRPICPVGSS